MALGQVAGGDRAEAGEAAGDQDGALGVKRGGLGAGLLLCLCETRHLRHSLAQGDLRLLLERQRGGERALGCLAAVGVDQREAAGVL